MSASTTDNFMQVAPEADITYMTGTGKGLGATSFTINSSSGWPTTTGFIIAVRTVDANGNEVPGTYTEWAATQAAGTVTINATPVYGSDQVYTAGTTTQVYIPVSSVLWNRLINALLNQHNQDGSHGAITNTTITASGLATLNGGAKITNALQLVLNSIASSATPTINSNATNFYAITALAANTVFAAPTGSPVDGQSLTIRIRDNGAGPFTIGWNAIFRAINCTLPTSSSGQHVYVSARYNAVDSVWDVLAVGQ